MKRLLFLALALLATACAPSLPSATWCYSFDFASSDYGFTVEQGAWTPGAGFTPDAAGWLTVSYTHSVPVTPSGAIIDAYRADTNNRIPIEMRGKATVFGINTGGTVSTLVPSDVNSARIVIAPGTGEGSYTGLLFSGWASRTVILNRLQVRGDGVNPFPSSNCDTTPLSTGSTQIVQVPGGQMLDALEDANSGLGSLTGPLAAPDGQPLLPSINTATLFGYAKWIISGTAAQELLGPFAPVATHTGILIGLMIGMIVVYLLVFGTVYLVSWVVWIFKLILMIIQAIASIIDSVVGSVVKGVVKFIGAI